MKNFSKILFLIALFFIATNLYAQNDSLLKDLQKKFISINDLTADVIQLTNGRINLQGKFYYKKENKLRLELKNIIIVSDGKTNWNYNKKQKKVIISDFDKNDPSAVSLKKIILDYPLKCKVSEVKESGKRMLVLIPNPGSEINAEEIKILLSNENLIDKVYIKSNTGSNLEFRFSNYKINPGIKESEFIFNTPKGTKTIDLR